MATIPSGISEGALDRECRRFIHARFYAKFRMLIDDIDPHPFTSIFDIGESNSDNGILRDPRKIAIETRYIISNFRRLKDFHPPAEEFAVQYAARPDLDARCSHDLDITGMKN